MTFSNNLKTSIVNNVEKNADRMTYVILGVLLSAAKFDFESLVVTTENSSLAKMLLKHIKHSSDYKGEVKLEHIKSGKKRSRYKLIFSDSKSLLSKFNLKNLDGIPNNFFKNEKNKRDYISGFFLGIGYMSDPEKSYHVEFVCKKDFQAESLYSTLVDISIKPGKIQRANQTIIYLKDSSKIADLLSVMGAYSERFSFENTLIIKDIRNKANRLTNCDTANLSRIADVSFRQIKIIKFIEKQAGLNSLDDKLRKTAEIRLLEPEMSLSELGAIMDPPIGKSGMNHRMRKIESIARKLGMTELDLKN